MRSAAASTLESLAAESITYAIYSTALGFLRLAQHDPAGASAAFTAAATWGSVGAAAAVAGRVIAPPQSGDSASGGAAAGAAQGGASSPGVGGASQPGVHNTFIVQGNLVGWTHIGELTAALNDAVLNKDVTLTATNTKTGQVVTR